jgi:NitT/TauT family transport system ATP-binding protein
VTGTPLATSGVTKRFGDVAVIEPLDLDVAAGQIVSLLGPSGCGKSTLLRILAGLDAPSAGTVAVGGSEPGVQRLAKRVALVPQQPGLLPWRTVRANAASLLEVRRDANPADLPDVGELLAEVGLADAGRLYPHQLSGGMQQRVALVRGFALGAPLLLLDEPFAALDEITRADMRDLLLRLVARHPATVVFVTHSVSEACFVGDRVLVCSPRPMRVVADLAVDLPRPRTRATEDGSTFVAVRAAARDALAEAMGRT